MVKFGSTQRSGRRANATGYGKASLSGDGPRAYLESVIQERQGRLPMEGAMPHARNCMPLAAVLLVLTACANKE